MPHMAASPFTVNGLVDGQARGAEDAARVGECPPRPPLGMEPDKAWSFRYQRGYNEAFSTATPHRCGPECGNGAA